MSSESAFVGQPPASQQDKYLIKAMFAGKVPIDIKAPPGYVYETRAPGFIAGVTVAIFLVVLITSVRIGIRTFHKRMKFGADDIVIIPAAIASIGYLVTLLIRVNDAGVGKHLWDVTYLEASKLFTVGNVGQILFWAAVGLTKISITLFNRRLTGISSKNWQYIHMSFLAVLVVFFIVSFFLNTFPCHPYAYRYNYVLKGEFSKEYKCLNLSQLNYAFNVFHALTDFMLLTVPIIILSRVNLPLGTKLRLCLIFSFGSVSCIASAMRIVVVNQSTADFTWSFVDTIPWTIVDATNTVIVASLPTLNVLIDKYWPKQWTISGNSFLSRRTGFNSGSKSKGSSANKSDVLNTTNMSSTNTESMAEKATESSRKSGIVRHDEFEVGYRNADSNSQKDQLPYGQIPDSLRNSQNADRQAATSPNKGSGQGQKNISSEVKSVGSDDSV